MGIPRSTFYYQVKENNVKAPQESFLQEKIKEMGCQYPYYGYQRITAQLQRDNIKVNHKRVLRIMRQLCIQARIKRRYTTTTNSRHNKEICSNLIKDLIPTGINQIWYSDITYIRILSAFVYLATILDIYSCRIIGYAIVNPIPGSYSSCLKDGFGHQEGDKPDPSFRSGIPYTSLAYTNLLHNFYFLTRVWIRKDYILISDI